MPVNFPRIVGKNDDFVSKNSVVQKQDNSETFYIKINNENLDISKDQRNININLTDKIDYSENIDNLSKVIEKQNDNFQKTMLLLEHGYINIDDVFVKIEEIEENIKDINIQIETQIQSIKLEHKPEFIQEPNWDLSEIDKKLTNLESISNNLSVFKHSILESISDLSNKIYEKIDSIKFPEIEFPQNNDKQEIINQLEILNEKISNLFDNSKNDINNLFNLISSNYNSYISLLNDINKNIINKFESNQIDNANLINFSALKLQDCLERHNKILSNKIDNIYIPNYNKDFKYLNSKINNINENLDYYNQMQINNINNNNILAQNLNNIKYLFITILSLSILSPPIWLGILYYFFNS